MAANTNLWDVTDALTGAVLGNALSKTAADLLVEQLHTERREVRIARHPEIDQ